MVIYRQVLLSSLQLGRDCHGNEGTGKNLLDSRPDPRFVGIMS